ncbi:altronate dehydratase family protein [Sphingomonas sp. Y38-1Y]|uniref:UxaA family hydrolase n=1 Tax=Sphingomonas sp. Y38-1Y TaxID=3078265 RepID=UPI0028E5519E|nr:altronate dehydratase family protein [Sphingomonas sp. Y38-1Y]
MIPAIRLSPDDDVAVLVAAAGAGDPVLDVVALGPIAAGHKIAVRPVDAGSVVHKYGEPIGIATQAIRPGEHVHDHNLQLPTGGIPHRAVGRAHRDLTPGAGAFFEGYRRGDGRVGTRNAIGIVASVNCSATVVRRIARAFEDGLPEGIDAIVPLTHSGGCGMASSGEAFDTLARTLSGFARHPNFGGVLLIGLGCEVAQIERLVADDYLATSERVQTLNIQTAGGTAEAIEAGTRIVRNLIEAARHDRRERCPASDLILGLQCGGSDGWSGITANPALGNASDRLIAAGGTALLSETPEIFGAEHLLYARSAHDGIADALAERVAWWEAYAASNGASLDNNPSPGNKAGGLTTIYEKSLGAIAKAGSAPLNEVVHYAQRPTRAGLVFMDSPGYDPCSATGQIASGANLLAFTTGRGSIFGSQPTPCLKLASNAALAARMTNDIDIDCSPILTGTAIEDVGASIFDLLLQTASGRRTKSERNGLGDFEFVPWRLGAWL